LPVKQCMGPMAKGNKNYTEKYILEKALQNLEKLDVIGIMEHLNLMIRQLRFHLPHLIPRSYKAFKRDNVHNKKKKSVLDYEARRIMHDWGWVYRVLYERGKELYQQKQALAEKCLKLLLEHDEDDDDGDEFVDSNDR